VEFIGTLALIFIGAGSIVADRLTGGGVSLVGIALAHGLTIAVMVSAFGHISGGHFNPAVTIGALVAKKISPGDAVGYWIAQLAGGVSGALLLTAVFDAPTWKGANLGTPGLATGVTTGQGLVFEIVATFFSCSSCAPLRWIRAGRSAPSPGSRSAWSSLSTFSPAVR
jgi:aquaporin Z